MKFKKNGYTAGAGGYKQGPLLFQIKKQEKKVVVNNLFSPLFGEGKSTKSPQTYDPGLRIGEKRKRIMKKKT